MHITKLPADVTITTAFVFSQGKLAKALKEFYLKLVVGHRIAVSPVPLYTFKTGCNYQNYR